MVQGSCTHAHTHMDTDITQHGCIRYSLPLSHPDLNVPIRSPSTKPHPTLDSGTPYSELVPLLPCCTPLAKLASCLRNPGCLPNRPSLICSSSSLLSSAMHALLLATCQPRSHTQAPLHRIRCRGPELFHLVARAALPGTTCAGNGVELPQATAGYSSPQMLAALDALQYSNEKWLKPVDFLAHDRWSLGCILCLLLSGCHPFHPSVRGPLAADQAEYVDYVMQRQDEWVSHAATPVSTSMPATLAVHRCHAQTTVKLGFSVPGYACRRCQNLS